MTIRNHTAVTLEVLDKKLEPYESFEYAEGIYGRLDIHSDIGSCIIIIDYGQIQLKNFGRLTVKCEKGKNKTFLVIAN